MARVVVTTIIFDREANLRIWAAIWKQCARRYPGTEWRVVHNVHDAEGAKLFKEIVEDAGGVYIPRANGGMDIGALQDVAKGRLAGFDMAFEFLIWFTDDTFPVRESFVDDFLTPFSTVNVGMTCYEMSREIRLHVRTTGFCLRVKMLRALLFPVDPIKTKEDCWAFEHRSVQNMLMQVKAQGNAIVQINPDVAKSSVWDTGKKGTANRWAELKHNFPAACKDVKEPLVMIMSTAYHRHPIVAHSLLLQTYKKWALVMVHDGPSEHAWQRSIPADLRIEWQQTAVRKQNYGHPLREQFLRELAQGKHDAAEYILITNDDNYYVPVFLERMVFALEQTQAPAAYVGAMSHSYTGPFTYDVIPGRPARGFIDCGGVIVRRSVAARVPWPNYDHSSDWAWFEAIAAASGGFAKWVKVDGCLFVHN